MQIDEVFFAMDGVVFKISDFFGKLSNMAWGHLGSMIFGAIIFYLHSWSPKKDLVCSKKGIVGRES